MSERNELEKAIDYAIETDNCLFYEEAKRWKEVEHAKVYLCDINPKAIEIVNKNAKNLKVHVTTDPY